jgi:hypothetical protein
MAEPEGTWPSGWDQHEREQRRARLALSHRERLAWLEQAKAFARVALGAARASERSLRQPR